MFQIKKKTLVWDGYKDNKTNWSIIQALKTNLGMKESNYRFVFSFQVSTDVQTNLQGRT